MKEHGIRLDRRYPRLLAAFGAWIGIGAAILLFATEQRVFGSLLILGSLANLFFAIKGSRMSERVYQKGDIFVQWIILLVPVGSVVLMLLLLARFVFPIFEYLIGYVAVLVVLAALAGRELRRGMPVD